MSARTPSQTVGPYYAIGLSRRVQNELVAPGDPSSIVPAGRFVSRSQVVLPDFQVRALFSLFLEPGMWKEPGRISRPGSIHAGVRTGSD